MTGAHDGFTRWGENIDRDAPLNDYPRPQLMRPDWLCLNGQWSYEICPEGEMPLRLTGAITVPFPPEAPLSGAARGLRDGEMIWYGRSFTLPPGFMKDRLLLNFGAVDQWCEVFINGQLAGTHEGGYLPFTVDITQFVHPDEDNRISVSVYDITDDGPYAFGSQSLDPQKGRCPAQSGIWQTVWLESVPQEYISSLRITPDHDGGRVTVEMPGCPGTLWVLFADGKRLMTGSADENGTAVISIPDFVPWSPENPFLYELVLLYGRDLVKTYFAMRKISAENGVLMLNNKPVFLTGVIDQGLWSDGLYTAPSDEAMIHDISAAKSMGFNLIRKAAKIEPLRWYYHCDRLGMLVWQDFPAGGTPSALWSDIIPRRIGLHLRDTANYSRLGRGSARQRGRFEIEMEQSVNALYNCPCIICWSIFDEGRGQFDASRLAEKLKTLDPTRTVDHAGGWHDQGAGDYKSRHVYSDKIRVRPDDRVYAITLLDGFVLSDGGAPARSARRRLIDAPQELTAALTGLYREKILPLKDRGVSVCIYSQLSDSVREHNGLISFDRAFIKADTDAVLQINKELKGETT